MKSKQVKAFIFLITGIVFFSSCGDKSVIKEPLFSIGYKSSEAFSETFGDNKTEIQNITGELKISYLDVGQGDSTFIILPTGETLLIDAGGERKGRRYY